jgi:hypothetical protein
MKIDLDTMIMELEEHELLAMGWKKFKTSCQCGHDEAWMAPCQYGNAMSGCSTCTSVFIVTKRTNQEFTEWTQEEMDADRNEKAVLTTGEGIKRFWDEQELDPHVRKDYLKK